MDISKSPTLWLKAFNKHNTQDVQQDRDFNKQLRP